MTVGIGAVVGAVGGAVVSGYFGNKAADKQAGAMDNATAASMYAAERQADIAEGGLALEREQFNWQKGEYAKEKQYVDSRRKINDQRYDRNYTRWESIYGPLVNNLGDFYRDLSSETFASAGLTELARSFAEGKENIVSTLTQRGLGGGALEASLLAQGDIRNAEAEATIRRDAPFQVAEMKSNFLTSLGTPGSPGQPTNPTQPSTAGVQNATNAYGQAVGNVGAAGAQGFTNKANLYGSNANSLYSSAGNLLSTGINFAVNNWGGSSSTPANNATTYSASPGSVDYGSMFNSVDLSVGANG